MDTQRRRWRMLRQVCAKPGSSATGRRWHGRSNDWDMSGGITAIGRQPDATWLKPGNCSRRAVGCGGKPIRSEGLAGLAMEAGDVGQAARLYAEALGLRQATGAASGTVDILAGVASVARAVGQLRAAARLLGASAGIAQQLGVMPFVRVREAIRRSREALEEALGEASFAAAWRSGEALTLEQAIEEARTIAESAARTVVAEAADHP